MSAGHDRRRWARALASALAVALAGTLAGGAAARAADSGAPAAEWAGQPDTRSLGRQVLAPNDGWAAAEGGVSGGSAATAENVHVVRDRAGLVAAVAGDEPKIVYVVRSFNVNVDDQNQPLSCSDYADPAWDFDAYLAAYDPAVWTGAPTGPVEDARKASNANQGARVVVNVGSNTTIIGRPGVVISGIQLAIESAQNVIVRHLTLRDAYTCFPGWNGDDWKTEWDNLVVSRSSHVWIDHVTADDGEHPDAAEPVHFGKRLLRHDGLLDIVRGSDLVTVSWCRLVGHDKSLLWGNGDTATGDLGKLRITMHHSALTNLTQRGPRVRFGQVHVYNNLYTVAPGAEYHYSWGVGVQSAIYAQNNAFRLDPTRPAAAIIANFGGTAIHEDGTLVNGRPVDVLAAYNAANDPDLGADVGWTPTLHTRIDPTAAVARIVQRGAGASNG